MSARNFCCAKCDSPLNMNDHSETERTPCPNCGSETRAEIVSVSEEMTFHDSLLGKLKRPSLRSDDKLRWVSFNGVDYSIRLGKLVRKVRLIDRDADSYIERITDMESGEIIHECVEPLSEHYGHGSAKNKS